MGKKKSFCIEFLLHCLIDTCFLLLINLFLIKFSSTAYLNYISVIFKCQEIYKEKFKFNELFSTYPLFLAWWLSEERDA
jgi:hypothetical protein